MAGKQKIYTRRGDKGETSLIFGLRVSKNHPRIEVCGSIDELNAVLGVTDSFLKDKKIKVILSAIQNELFNIGAEIASPKKLKKSSKDNFYQLPESKTLDLEKIIDQFDARLTPLSNFILPKGSNASTLLHLARTICRRAERSVVSLSKQEKINSNILIYLNRLADLLFVFARYANMQSGVEDTYWKKD